MTDGSPTARAERVLVCVAWPYAHSGTHLGQVAGAILPGDIFARYQRMAGRDVLMLSGSDEHGTPITLDAEREGMPPREFVARFHLQMLAVWQRLGISWDIYTETTTATHARIVQEVFLRLLERGHIFRDTMESPYCPTDERFLPDRYVIGTCPYCASTGARGDQCDACGRTLDPTQLLAPSCLRCGSRQAAIEIRPTEHFFLDLPAFEQPLRAWLAEHAGNWRPSVLHDALNWLREGLRPRAITRDIEWGVAVPVPGFEQKRIYVWVEALLGYYSATVAWAEQRGEPEAWRRWWVPGPDGRAPARAYYFIGKDNIAFHSVLWPALLLALGGMALPYDVPANAFLLMGGTKASTSRGNVLSTREALERYGADPLRYYLASTMPEERDTTFAHEEVVRRVNEELVGTYGNAVHRVLTFVQRHYAGTVPTPGPLTPGDTNLLAAAREALVRSAAQIEAVRLRDGLATAMGLARALNRYLDACAPWKLVATDPPRAATVVHTALQALSALKLALAPYLPFSAQRVHELLGGNGAVATSALALEPVPAGRVLPAPEPLFALLESERAPVPTRTTTQR